MLDLLAPFVKQAGKVIWPPILPGDSYYGRYQPANYRLMMRADNSWVFAAARINAQNVAKAPLRLFKKGGKGGAKGTRVEVDEHPLLDLLRNVNDDMNRFDLFELTALYQELVGNAYWYLAPTKLLGANGQPIPGEIWPLLAQYVRVVPGTERMVDGYIYQLPFLTKPVAFTPEEIIHFKFPNPENIYYGKGCVEGGQFAIDSNEYQKRYEVTLFKNMARPDGILSAEKELTETQIAQIRAQWRSLFSGASRTGNIAILQKGMKYQQTAINPKELDYLRGRIATREEILATFGVPGSKMGLTEHVNRANAVANDLTYQSETILPRLRRLEEKLNERLTPIYDDQLEVEFDNPAPDDQEFDIVKDKAYLEAGVYTINYVREGEGLDPVSWGDKPLVAAGVAPLGTAPQPANAPPPKRWRQRAAREQTWRRFVHAADPVERAFRRNLQEYFIQQRRIVESNLNKLKAYAHLARAKASGLADLILFPLQPEQQRLADRSQSFIEQSLATGSALGMDQLPEAVSFDVLNPMVMEALKDRVEFFSHRVTQSTAEELIAQIGDGVSGGESITQIAARIGSIYDQAIGWRSVRIARTETISAFNSGALLSYQSGGATSKEWLTAGDERVRPTHQDAEGQVVGITSKFMVGGEQLDHPGDPMGSPEEIINCRCVLLPAFDQGGE